MTIDLSTETRRDFAQRQYNTLRDRGFSRKVASKIMKAAGPCLAVRSAEWANELACHFGIATRWECELSPDTKTEARRGEFKIYKTKPQNVADAVSWYLERAESSLGRRDDTLSSISCSWKNGRVIPFNIKNRYRGKGKFRHRQDPPPPTSVVEDFLKMVRGAGVALPHIHIDVPD